MRILITGKNGQVARCLADLANRHPNLELFFAARSEADVFLDLSDNQSIRSAVEKIQPNIVISAAAYTAVDQAEDEPDIAMQCNGVAPGILANEAAKHDAKIIHISTDYVFDGEHLDAYLPSHAVNPINVYGKTKLSGEIAVRNENPNHTILRTAWGYSPYGKNFLKTMLHLAEKNSELRVVDDQIGTPTSAYEVANGILRLCDLWFSGSQAGLNETHHLVGDEAMSWYGFAKKIFTASAAAGGVSCDVRPISTDEFPMKASRPQNSRLDRTSFLQLLEVSNLNPHDEDPLIPCL